MPFYTGSQSGWISLTHKLVFQIQAVFLFRNQVFLIPLTRPEGRASCFTPYVYSIKKARLKKKLPQRFWARATGARYLTRIAKISKSQPPASRRKIEKNWDGNWMISIFLKIKPIYLLLWSLPCQGRVFTSLSQPSSPKREEAPLPLSFKKYFLFTNPKKSYII